MATLNNNNQQSPVNDTVSDEKTSEGNSSNGSVGQAGNRPRKQLCRFGNYPAYYGYRNRYMFDSRLQCMRPVWFKNKRVLDIGCNTGVVTYQIAQKFLPEVVIGVDIDRKLIDVARFNVRYYVDKQSCSSCPYPTSCVLEAGPCIIPSPLVDVNDASDAVHNSTPIFPLNISFIAGNYVLQDDKTFQEYCEAKREQQSAAAETVVEMDGGFDVILVLSVTKWIHVNWGDAGVQRLFKRVFHDLKPGGIFILEPQEWKSYEKLKKDRKLERDQLSLLQDIKFKPDQFVEYLCKQVGFEPLPPSEQEALPAAPQHSAKGFQRPLHLLRKPLRSFGLID